MLFSNLFDNAGDRTHRPSGLGILKSCGALARRYHIALLSVGVETCIPVCIVDRHMVVAIYCVSTLSLDSNVSRVVLSLQLDQGNS